MQLIQLIGTFRYQLIPIIFGFIWLFFSISPRELKQFLYTMHNDKPRSDQVYILCDWRVLIHWSETADARLRNHDTKDGWCRWDSSRCVRLWWQNFGGQLELLPLGFPNPFIVGFCRGLKCLPSRCGQGALAMLSPVGLGWKAIGRPMLSLVS